MSRREFTPAEIDYIKKYYADNTSGELAEKLNRPICSVYNKAHALGLKKSDDFFNSGEGGRLVKGSKIGQCTRFKKGHSPKNKGKKMSAEQYEKCKHTFFKKGQKSHNEQYDGHISIRTDKRTGNSYFYIRLSKGNYQPLHRVLWEKENGKILKGMNLIFIDGDQSNVSLDNLQLISEAENMKRNSLHNYPKEIKDLIQLKGALQRQINKILNDE